MVPVVWKSHFWGTWRDQRLLKRLLDLPKLNNYIGTPRKPGRFIKGQGFQIFNPKPTSDIEKIKKKKNPERPWWPSSMLFLSPADMADVVVTSADCNPVGTRFTQILFPRDPSLFKGPKVLISQGSKDMKVAFCDFEVIFQSFLQAITGKRESDKDALRFLSAVIKSNVIQYYLFHTSANWGTERDKVLFYELLSMPFFLPEDAPDPKKARKIVDAAAQKINRFEQELKKGKWLEGQRENEAKKVRTELEPLVRDYYDIDEYEAMLIKDTLDLSIKSSTPGETTKDIPTLKKASSEKCEIYTKTLCEMLNHFGKGSSFKVAGEIIRGEPYSIVHVSLTNKSDTKIKKSDASDRLKNIFNRMESLLSQKEDSFAFCRNLKVFDGDNLYILKPMQMRFWSRTAALNDADEIAGAILDSRETK
jgi:hypothetical protein